jgi:hypothetical protein
MYMMRSQWGGEGVMSVCDGHEREREKCRTGL